MNNNKFEHKFVKYFYCYNIKKTCSKISMKNNFEQKYNKIPTFKLFKFKRLTIHFVWKTRIYFG